MSFDPNLYAIKIELSIDSTAAFNSIDSLNRKIVNIEESLNKAINSTLAQASIQIQELTKQFDGLNNSVETIGQNHIEQHEQSNEFFKGFKELGIEYDKQLATNEELKELTEDNLVDHEAIFKTSQLQTNLFEKQNKLQSDTATILGEIVDKHSEIASISKTNSNPLEKSQKSFSDYIKDFDKAVESIGKAISAVDKYILNLVRLTRISEDFRVVNYRLYGGLHELAAQSDMIAGKYGLIGIRAREAFRAMMDINVPKAELERYTVTLTKVQRITGIQIETLQSFTKGLRGIGYTVGEVEGYFGQLIKMQANFGLTTSETTRILETFNNKLVKLSMFMNKDSIGGLTESAAAFMKFGKEAGLTNQVIDELNSKLALTGIEALAFYGAMGSLSGNEEERIGGILEQMDRWVNRMDAVKAAGGSLQALQVEMEETFRNAYGLDDSVIKMFQKIKAEAAKANMSSVEYFKHVRAMAKKGLDINGEYLRGIDGLTAAHRILTDAATTLYNNILHFIADSIIPYIHGISYLISLINQLIGSIVDWWKTNEKLYPILVTVRKAIQYITGALIIVGLAGTAFTGIVSGLSAAFVAFIGIIGTAALAVASFTGVWNFSLGSISATINVFFTSIGRAFVRFGAFLVRLSVPILAVGAAFLLAGAGAYLFAHGVALIAEKSDAGINALIGLTVAILALGIGLVTLANFAADPDIAVGLGILALTFLAIAAAAAIVIIPLTFLVEAFTKLLNSLVPDVKERLIDLGLGLLFVAAAGPAVLVGGGALMAGAILMAAGAAILIGASSLLGVSTSGFGAVALALLGAGVIYESAAIAIRNGTTILMESAKDMFVASFELAKSSISLVVSVKELAYVSVGLVTVSASLAIAGASLAMAVPLLLFSSIGLAFVSNKMQSSVSGLDKSTQIIIRFINAIKELQKFTLGNTIYAFSDISKLVITTSSDVDKLEDAAARFAAIRFDGSELADSIEDAAAALTKAAAALEVPIQSLSAQVDKMVAEIDKLLDKESEIQNLASELNNAMPSSPDAQTPNEIKNINNNEKVVNNTINNTLTETETDALLKRIIQLMEESKENNSGNPLTGEPLVSDTTAGKLSDIGFSMS